MCVSLCVWGLHLVSIFLGESDGRQFVVLLNEIFMHKKVQSTLLQWIDGILCVCVCVCTSATRPQLYSRHQSLGAQKPSHSLLAPSLQ